MARGRRDAHRQLVLLVRWRRHVRRTVRHVVLTRDRDPSERARVALRSAAGPRSAHATAKARSSAALTARPLGARSGERPPGPASPDLSMQLRRGVRRSSEVHVVPAPAARARGVGEVRCRQQAVRPSAGHREVGERVAELLVPADRPRGSGRGRTLRPTAPGSRTGPASGRPRAGSGSAGPRCPNRRSAPVVR